jgi:hypothetical protein
VRKVDCRDLHPRTDGFSPERAGLRARSRLNSRPFDRSDRDRPRLAYFQGHRSVDAHQNVAARMYLWKVKDCWTCVNCFEVSRIVSDQNHATLQINRFNNRLCFDEVIDDNRLDACRRTVDVLHAGDSERDQSSNSQFHVVSLHHIDDYDREARRRRQLQSAWGLLQNSVLLATSCGLASG